MSNLCSGGLACYFYSRLCIYSETLPSVLSPTYIFELGIPYIQWLLKHPRTCLKGLALARYLIQSEPGRIIREDISETPFFDLFQSLINFMINCPVLNIRTAGFKVTNAIIDQFADKTRLELLQALIQSCPYPSTAGLFITRIKDEAIKYWPASSDANKSIFTTSEILESFPLLTSEKDVFASLDIIMPVLNLIRFLLVKDKNTNYTSIWSKERQRNLRKDFLEPLEETVDSLLKEHLDPAQKKQEKKKMTTGECTLTKFVTPIIGGGAMPTLTEKEFEHSHSNAIYTLELIRDTIQRVKELIRGSEPLSGKPEIPQK